MSRTLTSDLRKPFYLSGKFIFGVMAAANLLNYIDRGIIPGSTNEINSFIKSDLNTSTPDVFLGLLQSSFIIGFMFGSIVFSHLIHTYGRFTLTGIGCSIWVVAVMLSGSAYYANSYVFLLFARILSGIAEASMQCAIPPWIQKTAPVHQKGLWLGIFYMAIPVGTAIGYAYSSICSENIGWQFAFFFEGFVMIPFVIFMFYISPYYPPDKLAANDDEQQHPSIWQEILIVCGRPVFLCFCMAYAAQSATLMGLSTFGSAFMMGLGFSNTESDASTLFGIVVSVSGMIATPLGGVLLDHLLSDHRSRAAEVNDQRSSSVIEEILEELDEQQLAPLVANETQDRPTRDCIYSEKTNKHLQIICIYICIFTAVGGTLLAMIYFSYSKGLYLFLVAAGCIFIFMTNSAIMMGVMLAVPFSSQSFGIAVNNVCLHGFGDVPAPVIVGYIKDVLAPGCIAKSDDDGNIAASDECRDDGEGLRVTMLVTTLWLVWVLFFYILAWFLCRRKFHLFSWGMVDFYPSLPSDSDHSPTSGENIQQDSSGNNNKLNTSNRAIFKEGANQSILWRGKTVNAPEDSLQVVSDEAVGLGRRSKDRLSNSVIAYDDSYLPDERESLMSSVFAPRSDHEKENETNRTNSADSAGTLSRSSSTSPKKLQAKSRVLSSDELSTISTGDKQKNIERMKRLSKESQRTDRQQSQERTNSSSISFGNSLESGFQRIHGKKGLLQRDSFANKLREMEDTIAI